MVLLQALGRNYFLTKVQQSMTFTKLFDSYVGILKRILNDNLVTLCVIWPLPKKSPYYFWYDGSKYCQYNFVLNHNTKNCVCLQHLIQDHTNSCIIWVNMRKLKENKLVDKENSDL